MYFDRVHLVHFSLRTLSNSSSILKTDMQSEERRSGIAEADELGPGKLGFGMFEPKWGKNRCLPQSKTKIQ